MIQDIYRSRVCVGGEQQVLSGGKCSECDKTVGEEHLPGCCMEQCPQCHGTLISCGCSSLCPYEAEQIIATLYAKITSMENALAALEPGTHESYASNSYLMHATMRYLFDNMPDDRRIELETLFHEQHPQLVPQLHDEDGNKYYTAQQLAEALNMPLIKVQKQIDAMVASGQGVRYVDGVRVKILH